MLRSVPYALHHRIVQFLMKKPVVIRLITTGFFISKELLGAKRGVDGTHLKDVVIVVVGSVLVVDRDVVSP